MHDIFLSLAIILFTARVVGDFFGRVGLPAVLGEIIVGILLGQSALGLIEVNDILRVLAELGVILLLFQVGLEADINQLKKVGVPAVVVAFAGALIPMFLGTLVGYKLFDLSLSTSLFLGGTLTATSIGITVGVLESMGKLKERFAQIVLGAAVLDDIFGVIVLTALAQFVREGKVNVDAITLLLLYIVIFFLLSPFMAQVLAKIIYVLSRTLKTMDFVPPAVVAVLIFF